MRKPDTNNSLILAVHALPVTAGHDHEPAVLGDVLMHRSPT